jgi:hypothetical protein
MKYASDIVDTVDSHQQQIPCLFDKNTEGSDN